MFGTTQSLPRSTRKLLEYTCVCLLICLATGFAFGQAEPTYTSNTSDQVLRGSGRVNPSTLGMEIQIPLGSYPGRGISMPINLSYSSKVWRMLWARYETKPGVDQEGCNSINSPLYSDQAAAGWTNSLEVPYIEYTGKDQFYNDNGSPYSPAIDEGGCVVTQSDNYAYIKRIVVHLPGGESHELRVDDTVIRYVYNSNCPSSPCDSNQASLQANWDATYLAADGSNLKYVEDSSTSTYRLLMPDGSHYDFASSLGSLETGGWYNATIRKASTYSDRNGNYITYHAADGSHPNGYITDTLGRTLDIPFGVLVPTSATDQTYTMPGLGSGNVTYHLIWKQLKTWTSR